MEEDVGGEDGAQGHEGKEEDGEVLESQLVLEPDVVAVTVQARDPAPTPRAAVEVVSEREPVDGRWGEDAEGDVEALEEELGPFSEIQRLSAVPSEQQDVEVDRDPEGEKQLCDRSPLG